MSNIFIELKKDLFGCFSIEEIRGKDNETGLKEGGGIEMSTTVLSIYAMHRSLPLKYSPCVVVVVGVVASSLNRYTIVIGRRFLHGHSFHTPRFVMDTVAAHGIGFFRFKGIAPLISLKGFDICKLKKFDVK